MAYEALTKALTIIKGQAALARAVGVSQPSVWHWVHKSRRVPAEYVLPVEAATGVSRHELRPDLYPVEARARRQPISAKQDQAA